MSGNSSRGSDQLRESGGEFPQELMGAIPDDTQHENIQCSNSSRGSGLIGSPALAQRVCQNSRSCKDAITEPENASDHAMEPNGEEISGTVLENDIVVEVDPSERNSRVSLLREEMMSNSHQTSRVEESVSPIRQARSIYRTYCEQQATDVCSSSATIMPPLQDPPVSHRREVSRETLRCYRETVTADHFIYYSDFENLMATNAFRSLAIEVSKFTQEQRGGQVLGDGRIYQGFIRHCTEILNSELNKTTRSSGTQVQVASTDRGEWTDAKIIGEGIEKFLTTKLYSSFFNVLADDHQKGKHLATRFSQLQHLTAADLDALPEVETHHTWSQAMFELEAMRFFKSPREKLFCGIRAFRLLQEAIRDVIRKRMAGGSSTALLSANQTEGRAGTTIGADDVFPCWMLLVLRAAPTFFYENVMYIDRFRSNALCTLEENYTLATLSSAVEFWSQCDDYGRIPEKPMPGAVHISAVQNSEVTQQVSNFPSGNLTTTSVIDRDVDNQNTRTNREKVPEKNRPSHYALKTQPPVIPARTKSTTSNENTMEDVRRWLVDERKTFDMLTVEELRTIVETTRQLFH